MLTKCLSHFWRVEYMDNVIVTIDRLPNVGMVGWPYSENLIGFFPNLLPVIFQTFSQKKGVKTSDEFFFFTNHLFKKRALPPRHFSISFSTFFFYFTAFPSISFSVPFLSPSTIFSCLPYYSPFLRFLPFILSLFDPL